MFPRASLFPRVFIVEQWRGRSQSEGGSWDAAEPSLQAPSGAFASRAHLRAAVLLLPGFPWPFSHEKGTHGARKRVLPPVNSLCEAAQNWSVTMSIPRVPVWLQCGPNGPVWPQPHTCAVWERSYPHNIWGSKTPSQENINEMSWGEKKTWKGTVQPQQFPAGRLCCRCDRGMLIPVPVLPPQSSQVALSQTRVTPPGEFKKK